MRLHKNFLLTFVLTMVSQHLAYAATGYVGPVYIDSVAAITTMGSSIPGGHQPGNLEIKIKNGFTLPSGVSCDTTYITTLKSADVDGHLFAILSIAKTKIRRSTFGSRMTFRAALSRAGAV